MAYAINIWDPFQNRVNRRGNSIDKVVNDIFNDFNNFSTRPRSSRNVDVSETEKSYEISVAAPGRDRSDFAVTLKAGVLRITLSEDNETKSTLAQSPFDYTWKTPKGVGAEELSAVYDAGILKVSVAKPAKEQVATETIDVN
jgi:HSP20 family protein|tara:strand:+ start:3611 stop:4036 length:426 start_codon:yes stop_codon:yes gene_type:complete